MTTGLCMKTPTWDGPLVKAVTGVGVCKLALTLILIMTGSSVALPKLKSRPRQWLRQN